MTLASYDDVAEAVLRLWGTGEDADGGEYDGIFFALGGVEGVTAKVWAAFSTFTTLGWDAMRDLLKTALVVPFWLAGKLGDFVDDLFDELMDIAEGEVEQAQEAGKFIVSKIKQHQTRSVETASKTTMATHRLRSKLIGKL